MQDDKKEVEQKDYKSIEITPKLVDKEIDFLEPYILNAVETRGFYAVDMDEQKTQDNQNNADLAYKNDDSEIQTVKQISFTDIVDITSKPPKIKDICIGKNVLFCDGNGKIYFGEITLRNRKDKAGNDRFIIVPNGKGRLYNNGKLEYAGYFTNGNKNVGIAYKQNGDTFSVDYKGNEDFQHHLKNDLCIAIVGDYVNENNSFVKQYDNFIKFSHTSGKQLTGSRFTGFNGVENIIVKFDNGYEYDFDRKNDDFLDSNGKQKKYSPEDEEKMYLNVDRAIKNIQSVLNKCGNTVKNIEIVSENNFGILNNRKGQHLMTEIGNKMREVLFKRKIKLFFKSTGKEDNVLEINQRYKNNESCSAKAYNNATYASFDADSGSWIYYETEDDYIKDIKDAGCLNNIVSTNEERNDGISEHELFDVITESDMIYNVNSYVNKKVNEEIGKRFMENQEKMNSEITQLHSKSPAKRELTKGEKAIVVLAGILLPVVGGVIAYYTFSKPNVKDMTATQEQQQILTPNITNMSEENKIKTSNNEINKNDALSYNSVQKNVNKETNINLNNERGVNNAIK